jgi:tripartite-type tricarboxylate transporter receptor subunit TctC
MQDLLSGQVQVMLIQGGGSIPQYVRTGKLVALGVSSLARSKFYPEVPTIAETYPGFESESWVAMFAPAATPRAVIERLHGTLLRLFADAAVRDRFESQGCDIIAGTPEQLARLVREDQAKWARIIRQKNITVE